jgi:putative ABC transport system ATP-binding protein
MNDPSNCFICIEDVSKSYSEGEISRYVLRKAQASFLFGEFVAILGKSGSGKSTLLNLISGIDLVDEGSIWINQQQLTSMSELQRTLFRRENIGFIFQFFNLIPTLTSLENVSLPLELKGTSQAKARIRAIELLEAVGLPDRQSTFPENLSGGEQQRVAIARALVHDPLLVLADEPTGNLDDNTGYQIMDLLDRLTRKSGKNLIMVTHNQEIATFADRIFYLKEGKLVLTETLTNVNTSFQQ